MILVVCILRAQEQNKKKKNQMLGIQTNFVLPGADRSCFVSCLKYRKIRQTLPYQTLKTLRKIRHNFNIRLKLPYKA